MDHLLTALDLLIQEKRRAGITNKALANQAGCSQPHINDLLNHKNNVRVGTLKFETLLRLLPEVRMVLERAFCNGAAASTATVNGNGSAAAVNGNATAAPSDSHLTAALHAIINDNDMCDKCRSIALRHLSKATHDNQ